MNCLTPSKTESPHRAFQRNPSISCTITLWHLDASEGVLGLPHLGLATIYTLESSRRGGFQGLGDGGNHKLLTHICHDTGERS